MSEYPYSPAFYQRQANPNDPRVGITAADAVDGTRIAALITVQRVYQAVNHHPTDVGAIEFDPAFPDGTPSHVDIDVLDPIYGRVLHTCRLDVPHTVISGLPAGGGTLPGEVWQVRQTRQYTHLLALKNSTNAGLEGQLIPPFSTPPGVQFAPITEMRCPRYLFATPSGDPLWPTTVWLPVRFRESFNGPNPISGAVRVNATTTAFYTTVQIELVSA